MLPAATAVTKPLELMVATEELEDVHVPPVAPFDETCSEVPSQISC